MAKSQKRQVVQPRFKEMRRKAKHFLREWREYRGMTLIEAGEKAGMTAGNISAMERYEQGFSEAGLRSLAEAYGALPGWLIDYDPEKLGELFKLVQDAKDEDQRKILDIAKTILGKTGSAD